MGRGGDPGGMSSTTALALARAHGRKSPWPCWLVPAHRGESTALVFHRELGLCFQFSAGGEVGFG